MGDAQKGDNSEAENDEATQVLQASSAEKPTSSVACSIPYGVGIMQGIVRLRVLHGKGRTPCMN